MNVADYISDTSGKDYYIVSREDLVSIADVIREKAGIDGDLVLPTGIVDATDNIVADVSINDMLTIGLPKISGNVIFTGTDLPFGAFAGNTGITSFTGNNMTKVFDRAKFNNAHGYAYTFMNCTNLQAVTMPNVTTFAYQDAAFYGCTNLRTFNIPFERIASFGGNNAFYNCTHLPSLVLPAFNDNFNQWMFYNCTSMEYVDVGAGLTGDKSIAANAFNGCSSLDTLIIRGGTNGSRKMTLGNISAFANTPFASAGTGGTLYVPSALVSTYQSATNWSTILGYTNNSIQAIEGSIYETQYADGTPIT